MGVYVSLSNFLLAHW